MPTIDNNTTLLLKCSCQGHVLEVTYDDYSYLDVRSCHEIAPDFCISVWNQSPTPHSFWARCKLIWRLLRGKNLEGGDVIINQSDAKLIIDFLNKNIRKTQNGKNKNKKKDTTRLRS